jgi:hypothetical protein
MNSLIWLAIHTDVPTSYMADAYRVLLADKEYFQKTCTDIRLFFPDTLTDVLQSDSAPSVDFFRSLNADASRNNVWGIYIILMEKTGNRPRLYVGSGTRAQSGVRTRLQQYNRQFNMSVSIRNALRKGYTITNFGLLCWASIPPAVLVPSARLRFLALEAIFCIIFFAGPESLDKKWSCLLLWQRKSVNWLHLCTHSPFTEVPKQLDMTDEQLAEYARVQREHYKKSARENGRKRRLADPEAVRAKERETRQAWSDEKRERMRNLRAGYKAKILSAKKYYCSICDSNFACLSSLNIHLKCKAHKEQVRIAQSGEPPVPPDQKFRCSICNINFTSRQSLKRHLRTKGHEEQVNVAQGGKPKSVSKQTRYDRKYHDRNRAERRFYCSICKLAMGTNIQLNKHLKSKSHLKAAAAASEPPTDKKYHCSTCNKTYKNTSQLNTHFRSRTHLRIAAATST